MAYIHDELRHREAGGAAAELGLEMENGREGRTEVFNAFGHIALIDVILRRSIRRGDTGKKRERRFTGLMLQSASSRMRVLIVETLSLTPLRRTDWLSTVTPLAKSFCAASRVTHENSFG